MTAPALRAAPLPDETPPAPGFPWATFGPGLREASDRVLMLDYDGTLAPFQDDRMAARPYPEARDALERILRSRRTRVAIVTGRAVEAVLPLLRLDPLPDIWGVHGWQCLRGDGRREDGDPGDRVREGIRRALEPAEEPWGAQWPGQWERKPISVSFHFRGLPEAEQHEFMARIEPRWRSIASEYGLSLHAFDFGMELRVPGRDKGTAVATMLGEGAAGPGQQAAAFLGDDFTDEDAFRELARRSRPGEVSVLVRPDWRPTAATAWLRPPEELIGFLDRWNEVAGG